jgi:hypothetical protein
MALRDWRERLLGAGTGGGLVLTSSRIKAAYGVAIATDVLQFVLGPFGWAFVDEILDVIALILTTRLLGFHPLLLPSFLLELVPIVDVLPTWTACVALVVATRKKQPPAPRDEEMVTIDVKPTRVI